MKTNKKNPAEPLTGGKLAKAVVNHILMNPDTWRQCDWHSACGTKHCFAGWCQIKSGKPMDSNKTKQDAKEALGISDLEAITLFRSNCTLGELYNFAKNFDLAGRDRDGFDRAGRGRDGFDRDGFDRAGFDRAGFDRDGFDRDGFDRDGKKLQLFKLED